MNRHIMSDLHPSHAYKRAQVVTGTTTVTNETGDDLSPADPINEDGIPVLVLPREFQGMNDHYGEHYNYTGIKRSDVEEVYDQLRLMSVEEIQGFAVDAAKATHKASYSTPGGAHHTDAEMAAVIKYSQEQGVDVEVLP